MNHIYMWCVYMHVCRAVFSSANYTSSNSLSKEQTLFPPPISRCTIKARFLTVFPYFNPSIQQFFFKKKNSERKHHGLAILARRHQLFVLLQVRRRGDRANGALTGLQTIQHLPRQQVHTMQNPVRCTSK